MSPLAQHRARVAVADHLVDRRAALRLRKKLVVERRRVRAPLDRLLVHLGVDRVGLDARRHHRARRVEHLARDGCPAKGIPSMSFADFTSICHGSISHSSNGRPHRTDGSMIVFFSMTPHAASWHGQIALPACRKKPDALAILELPLWSTPCASTLVDLPPHAPPAPKPARRARDVRGGVAAGAREAARPADAARISVRMGGVARSLYIPTRSASHPRRGDGGHGAPAGLSGEEALRAALRGPRSPRIADVHIGGMLCTGRSRAGRRRRGDQRRGRRDAACFAAAEADRASRRRGQPSRRTLRGGGEAG